MEEDIFRDVVGHFATGVTVITTVANEIDFGTTASAFTSLSMEPPMVLVCLNESSETRRAIQQSMHFGVNILAEDQIELATAFATKSDAKFETVEIARSSLNTPMIAGAHAHLECEVIDSARGGTHIVFIAQVSAAVPGSGHPLTYYRGQLGALVRKPG